MLDLLAVILILIPAVVFVIGYNYGKQEKLEQAIEFKSGAIHTSTSIVDRKDD